MLSKITIKNYFSIKDEVTLKVNKDITSIIGKNESGKSTILKAINKLNGIKIEKEEKNVSLKDQDSFIKGLFIIDKDTIKSINDEYESNNELKFYSLPLEYDNLYYMIEIRDNDNTKYYSLYHLDENNKYVQISSSIFLDRIVDKLKSITKEYDLTKEQKDAISSLYKLSESQIKSEIDNNLINLDFNDEVRDCLKVISSQIEPKKWISLLPKYQIIYFSSFDSILKDTILFTDVSNNQQAKNLLKIAKIDIDGLSKAFEEGNEQELEDLGTQCVEIVSKKFKTIFKQTDVDFKIKIRFGSGNKDLSFFTQDKTSGTKTISLSKRSDGFKWYLSLYLTLYDYLDTTDSNTNYVLLLDEPNLYLHPGAQNNLLYNVFYKEFEDTQIIYTTHSPYMIDSDNSYSIRIVEKNTQTLIFNSSREYAEKSKNMKDVDTTTPLLTALDLNISNSLIIDNNDILVAVEGIQDVYILNAMIKRTKMVNKFKNIKFIPGMSANKIPYLYSYLYGMGYNVYALFDKDKPGKDAIDDIISGDLEDDRINKLLKYDLVNPSDDIYLLEDIFSKVDKEKYLPTKSTIFYKRIFDEWDTIELEDDTINNFKQFLKELLNKLK